MVVAIEYDYPPIFMGPDIVAVLQRVSGAIHARPFAVPSAEHAII
jgi:hypothetical protein